MRRPLFDRPLHQDSLLRLGAFVVIVGLLWSSRTNVEVGGYFNPERLGNLVADVWWTAVWSVALLVALAWWRRRRRGPLPEAPPPPSSELERSGEWTDAPPLRTDLGSDGDGPLRRAPELRARLSATVTIVGEPVELVWDASGADHVLVSALPGKHPANGTEPLHLAQSAAVTVTAVNDSGTRTVRLPLVRVLPMPAITTMRLPAAPIMRFDAHVDVNLTWGDPVLQRLDAVLDEQSHRESKQLVTLPPPLSYRDIRDRIESAVAHLGEWSPVEAGRSGDVVPAGAGRVSVLTRLRARAAGAAAALTDRLGTRHPDREPQPGGLAEQDSWWPTASATEVRSTRWRRRGADSPAVPPLYDYASGTTVPRQHEEPPTR